MARKPTGAEALERAKEVIRTTNDADELRAAQSVVLPLELGLSIEQTASLLGKPASWVSRARLKFIQEGPESRPPGRRGGRRHAFLSEEEEFRAVRQAVVMSTMINGPNLYDAVIDYLAAKGLNPSRSGVAALVHRVVHRIAPGRSPADLSSLRHGLGRLWAEEFRRELLIAEKRH